MSSSLALQRALFRHQARQISALVQGGSPSFVAYQRRYERAVSRAATPISMTTVHRRISECDVVFVGDYHTLPAAQAAFLALVEHALEHGRRVVLALELVESRAQPSLDRFMAGRLGARAFLERIGHPYRGSFDIWPAFEPVLKLAKRARLEVLGIDHRARGPKRLTVRDASAAKVIVKATQADDRPLVMVLMGQFHVAPAHLPKAVLTRAKRPLKWLTVFQNAEPVFWSLAAKEQIGRVKAVELGPNALSLVNTSPVQCQRSFLDYVDAELGEENLEVSTATQTLRHLVRAFATYFELPVPSGVGSLLPGPDRSLKSLAVQAAMAVRGGTQVAKLAARCVDPMPNP